MKKALLSLAFAIGATAMLQAKGSGDQVLMTINNKPVTLNEFEYLFHKNNSQQATPQSIEEYLQMFITYKQKVADAEAEGIDKSEAFQNEFDGYRRDLAEPYLKNQEVEDSIVNAIYSRMKEEVDVSHIMIANRGNGVKPEEQKQRLDSIRTAIINGADFAQLARQFSIDRSVVRNGGHMGYITATRFPHTFEDAAYETPVGGISPVIETAYGYHIVKVNNRRPARGQVLVEHILKLTQGLKPAEAAAKKQQIDSIATLLANGADFATVAKMESDDPGSKRNGGKLQWFGTGMMVPEFETESFRLQKGEISAPVKTAYGYHIIHKLDSKDIEPLETLAPMIKNAIKQDERGKLARNRKIQQLHKKYKASLNKGNIAKVREEIIANGGVDSTLIARFITSNMPVAAFEKNEIPLSEVFAEISSHMPGTAEQQADAIESLIGRNLDNAILEAERRTLAETNAEYRNLLNEYRDGMLLFEVSDRKVWTKAKQDKDGLEKFFEKNRGKYTWDAPRYKAYVIFAETDSIKNAAHTYLATHTVSEDSIVSTMRKEFGKNVKVEKVIAKKGENKITDYLAFGGEKPETKGRWGYYFPYRDKVIDAPEEAADVRGAVTGDYQNMLEEQWVEQLKEKYPVKINKKVLKKAK